MIPDPQCKAGVRIDGEKECQGELTNSGAILRPRTRKLDAKKDFEVSQGELGDKFSGS